MNRVTKSGMSLLLAGLLITTLNAQSTDDDVFTLNPFEVSTEADIGYSASSAMSGTRTNELLANLPYSIQVLNTEFLEDIGALDYFEAMEFAVGADNVYNDSNTIGAVTGQKAGNQINFRGLPSVRQLKDGFPTYVPTDTYNTERIEISRGAGGLAYGDIDATGVINITSKRAQFRDVNRFQFRVDENNTNRYTYDFNRPLIEKKLAVRLNLLKSDVESWRERSGKYSEGVAAALRFEPFKDSKTIIDITYEYGNQMNWNSSGLLTDETAAYVLGTGTTDPDADPVLSGKQNNGVGMRRINSNASKNAWTIIDGNLLNLDATSTHVFRKSYVEEGSAAVKASDPQNPDRIARIPISADIVPWDQDWEGPDGFTENDFDVFNISLQQRVSANFNLWLAYNKQDERTQINTSRNGPTIGGGGNARSVYIDVNPFIPDVNNPGAVVENPNFEEYYINAINRRRIQEHQIDSFRLTGIYLLSLGDTHHKLIFGANHRDEVYENKFYDFGLSVSEIQKLGLTGAGARVTNNLVQPFHYMKDGNDENLRRPDESDERFAFNIRGSNLNHFEQSLSSMTLQHLGDFFHGKLHTNAGVSRDYWRQFANLPSYRDPVYFTRTWSDEEGNALAEGESIPVFLRTEDYITNYTVGGVYHMFDAVSFSATYLESSLYTDNIGADLFGNPRLPTSGSGYDYGVRLKVTDKVYAALTLYESYAENSSVNVNVGPIVSALNIAPDGTQVDDPISLTGKDSEDRKTTGIELELTANLTRNWTTRLSFSTDRVRKSSNLPQYRFKTAEAEEHLRGVIDPDTIVWVDPDDLSQGRIYQGDLFTESRIEEHFESVYEKFREFDESIAAPRNYRLSLVTRYSFKEGRLKGLGIGLSARWRKGKFMNQNGFYIADELVFEEILAEDDYTINPFVKYTRKFGKVSWTGQLNIDNLFDRVTNQGRISRYTRLTNPRVISFTNTLSF